MTVPLILDVDTGIDDALALMLAGLHPDADLRAVTCVGGNTSLANVVRNTLLVLESIGRTDVAVSAGAARPLLEQPVGAPHVHGEDGLADLDLAEPTMSADERHAIVLLKDTVEAAAAAGEPVTVVPLAPMTNIALFARLHPQSFAQIGRIVFMGGGAHVGNATPSAEFNVFHDPEACAMVLDACTEHDVDITMYGLDVFNQPQISPEQVAGLARLAAPLGPLVAGVAEFYGRLTPDGSLGLGDAGAVAAVLRPELLRTQRLPVRVELSGTWTRGRTIVDQREWIGDTEHDPHGVSPAMVDVGLAVDATAVADMWHATITEGPR